MFELCDGDLLSIVENRGLLEEPMARAVFAQTVAGLRHCHAQGVWHLDVKPDNLLVAGCDVKVADFGCASTTRCTSTRSGTVEYAAPEVCVQMLFCHGFCSMPGFVVCGGALEGGRGGETAISLSKDTMNHGKRHGK